MGFILKVEGPDTIDLGLDNILKVDFKLDTPDESNARSTEMGTSLIVAGKILTAVDGEAADQTIKLAQWAMVPAEKKDCYRKVSIQRISSQQVVRQFTFPNAFVVDYEENYDEVNGVGTFKLTMKQKRDKTENVKIEGGFESQA